VDLLGCYEVILNLILILNREGEGESESEGESKLIYQGEL
jgi:hypothetical protein